MTRCFSSTEWSAPAREVYRAVRNEVLDRYLDESVKAYRPPRFFLNDIVRYWWTMCVDFAGKEHELETLPADRIAQSFLFHDAVEPGARTFGAYDEFVGRMNDADFREELARVERGNSPESAAFADVQRIGRELQDGLLALLYETRALPQVVRDYAIF
jgi:hypothetical protein